MYIPTQRTGTNAQRLQGYSNSDVKKAEQQVAQGRLMFAFQVMSTIARVAKAAKQKRDAAAARDAEIAGMHAETVNFLRKAELEGSSPLTESMGKVSGVGLTQNDVINIASEFGIDYTSIHGGK